MRNAIMLRLCPVLIIAAVVCGCALSDEDGCDDVTDLEVIISTDDSLTSASDLVVITVRVENQGRSRVVFGYGSSSCRLRSFVRTGEDDYFILDSRICTRDVAEQALEPGQSRTESWSWDGSIWKDQQSEVLPPGRYEVFGAAGDLVSSAPVIIGVGPRLPRLGPTLWLDLDGDDSPDFCFEYAVVHTDDVLTSAATNFLSVRPYGGSRVQYTPDEGAIPLPDGTRIDAEVGWSAYPAWLAAINWSLSSGWESRWGGQWAGVSEMSLGLELTSGDVSHFGWAKISVDAGSSIAAVHDYGYQPVAGEPILGGIHP